VNLRLGPADSVLLLSILLSTAGELPAQSSLAGRVRQDSGGRPIAGVEVILEGTKHRTETNPSGSYRLDDLPSGQGVAVFRSVGFRPVRLRVNLVRGDTVYADVSLVPSRPSSSPSSWPGIPCYRGGSAPRASRNGAA
jgi:Carboxypeptidase regulatory-like domain